VETVNPKMQCTLDAAELVRKNREGELPEATSSPALWRWTTACFGSRDP
jgi:hypothetical protein